MKHTKKIFLFASVSITALAAAPSAAQDAPAETLEKSRSNDTIVVTARRREESLQDVPGSVTAIGASDLETFSAGEIGDVQSTVPNLTLHEGDAQNTVAYIRGVGQLDSLAFADPGVGIYLDDVYLGRAQGSFLDVFDLERIEVLRGPKAPFMGATRSAGRSNLSRANPQPHRPLMHQPLMAILTGLSSKLVLVGQLWAIMFLAKHQSDISAVTAMRSTIMMVKMMAARTRWLGEHLSLQRPLMVGKLN